MKIFFKLIPIILLGFYLFTPSNAFAAPAPEPNLHLLCDSLTPISSNVWQPQKIEVALRACPDYLPYSSEIIALIRHDHIDEVAVALDSAEAREAIKALMVQNDCRQLNFQTIDDIVIGTINRPTYCTLYQAFGCMRMMYIVSPYSKILYDFGELNVLPAIALAASIIIGGKIGRWGYFNLLPKNQKQPPAGRKFFRLMLQVIGLLILLFIVFVVSVIYRPPIANWLLYPSVPEFIIRAGIITAILTVWVHRYKQISK